MNENIVVINIKVNKIEYQTFNSKELVRDETPSVLLDTTPLPLERIVLESSITIADGSTTR